MFSLIRYFPNRRLVWRRAASPFFWDEPVNLALRYMTGSPIDLFNRRASLLFNHLDKYIPFDDPAVDLYEEHDRLVVQTRLPGVDEEDIDVTVQNGYLNIQAQHESRVDRNHSGYSIRGQRYSRWRRSVHLPYAVDANRASAVLEDGVLTISLPRHEPREHLIQRIKAKVQTFQLPFFSKKQRKVKIKQIETTK